MEIMKTTNTTTAMRMRKTRDPVPGFLPPLIVALNLGAIAGMVCEV
jgi:hypothetical protein